MGCNAASQLLENKWPVVRSQPVLSIAQITFGDSLVCINTTCPSQILQVSRLKKPHVSNETQISLTDSRLHMLASYPLLPPLHECLYVPNLLVLYGDVKGS